VRKAGRRRPYYDVGWNFSKMAFCISSTYSVCDGTYVQNNNQIQIEAKPGDELRVSLDLRDHDWGSADDNFCKLAGSVKVRPDMTVGPAFAAPIYWNKPYAYNPHVMQGAFGVPDGLLNICYLHWASGNPT
jgi:hypothetical protein